MAGLAIRMPVFFYGRKPGKYYRFGLVYGIVQAIGSTMVLAGRRLYELTIMHRWWYDLRSILVICGYLIKMGIFPFHF